VALQIWITPLCTAESRAVLPVPWGDISGNPSLTLTLGWPQPFLPTVPAPSTGVSTHHFWILLWVLQWSCPGTSVAHRGENVFFEVIHDYNNTRVACGLIHHSTLPMPQYAVLSAWLQRKFGRKWHGGSLRRGRWGEPIRQLPPEGCGEQHHGRNPHSRGVHLRHFRKPLLGDHTNPVFPPNMRHLFFEIEKNRCLVCRILGPRITRRTWRGWRLLQGEQQLLVGGQPAPCCRCSWLG